MYLEKDKQNNVILELTLKSSIANPHYLFEFISDMEPENKIYFTGTDLSGFKCRYNRFIITETGSTYVNLLDSTVNLKTGQYTYNVYEASAQTLSLSATTGSAISAGNIAIVDGEDSDLPTIYR